jgi:4-amino-4-deoxy-L-arabinose transferase-like glycosyltransferase
MWTPHRSGNRGWHYALLAVAASLLLFPSLGSPSLWDIDEGNNAEAAREMLAAGDWVVPTFNYRLRVDKPALLYWLEIFAYKAFGINEFAARLPSALAALATVLLAYELGRCLFQQSTGLLGALILASTIGFSAAGHFANPDALLNALAVSTLLFLWLAFSREQSWWFVPAGMAAGLATLAKGPVGVVLPLAVSLLFLLWNRRLALLWNRRLVWGAMAFVVVALPWYVLVANETRAAFLRGFLGQHNVGRFLSTMENHGGPFCYYGAVLLVGLMPWSVFLGPVICFGLRQRAREDAAAVGPEAELLPGYRFLYSWIVVYVVFFTLSATKLPNYVLPVYAPSALLIARFLDRWRLGQIAVPGWVIGLCLSLLGIAGVSLGMGVLVVSGRWGLPHLQGREFPALEPWAVLGAVPASAAVLIGWLAHRERRLAATAGLAAAALAFTGLLAIAVNNSLDRYKAPRELVTQAGAQNTLADIRIGCFQYFQPSLVFYCRREVEQLRDQRQVEAFLRSPLPSYLVVPAVVWQKIQTRQPGIGTELVRHYDLYRHCDVVVVGNGHANSVQACPGKSSWEPLAEDRP